MYLNQNKPLTYRKLTTRSVEALVWSLLKKTAMLGVSKQCPLQSIKSPLTIFSAFSGE